MYGIYPTKARRARMHFVQKLGRAIAGAAIDGYYSGALGSRYAESEATLLYEAQK